MLFLLLFLGYHCSFLNNVYSLLGIVRVKFFVLHISHMNLVFRCSIFKVQSLPALADSFVIISPRFSFVKYFLKVFSKSFFGDICSPFFRGALLVYHNKFRLSSTFLNFFQVFSSADSVVHCLATA